jgi:CheY-like chemotaxis protein
LNLDPSTWVVLIIEDDTDNLELVQRILLYHRAAVYAVQRGKQGLEMLETLTPTLILLDLWMPEMDGWTVLQKIRSEPRTAKLPVIALTAHAMKGARDEALMKGFDGYISKPFRIAELLELIQECLMRIDSKRSRAMDAEG